MARLFPNKTAPSPSSAMPKLGAPSNVNHEKSPVLRAPRIRAIATRNYGKGVPSPYPDMDTQNYGSQAGYGPKGG